MRTPRIIYLLFLVPCALLAQPDRITTPIDARRMVVLKGKVHPMAQPRFDQGPVEPAFRLGYITLMLKKTDAQQAALEQLLEQQQDPASPNYRDWLTPEQYADRFGLSRSDLDKISAWLQSQGFAVEYVARGRNWLVFSGTAGQVLATFRTEIHRYLVDGEMHFAAAAEPWVPASLEPLVAGFAGLDDFYPKPPRRSSPANTSSTGTHTLVPDDIATIYDIAQLYQAGFDGTGVSIVVVGQSAIATSDIQGFRSQYNLPAAALRTELNPNSSDPGTSSSLMEADIDLEWAGAVAYNATLIYLYGTSADAAASYAIDQNLAPIISESFGDCETKEPSLLSSYRTLAQQANVQGITWLASTGDSGAAACDIKVNIASQGLAVNFPASIPEVTAVGGTEFNEGSVSYWNTTNTPNGASAKSYIPEKAWNDTAESVAAGGYLDATGGGASSVYPKPAWQTGPGVPSDGKRDLPDVSFSASNWNDYYNVLSGGKLVGEGGTSVSTPVFAGIVALLNQYLVANKGQSKPGAGNINPTLYQLAQSAPNAFHDITVGSNMVPCAQGTPNCSAAEEFGYSAGPGYDLATGLGSVDAYNLVTQWPSSPSTGSTASMVLSSSPATVALIQDTTHCPSSQFPYYQQLNLEEQNGYEVQLSRFLAGGNDNSSMIASYFGSWRLAPFGSLQANLCWSMSNPPQTVAYEVDGTDTSGHTIIATLSVLFQSPTNNPGALSISKSSVAMSASPSQSAAASVNVSVPSGQPWTVSVFPANEKSGWLAVSPLSGTGPAQVNLVAAASGLADGVYTTTLIFQSANTFPQFVNVPVTFTIGASSAISIGGVANGASFLHVYAPGMVLSVFGTNLTNSTQTAYTLPLPLSMAGVSATVNGVAAPLYGVYALQQQLNIQIPYETATGTALLAVNNNGQVATYSFTVSASAPGIYLGPTGAITPNASGSRGQVYTLFITGAGEVSPEIATGAAPTGTQVPVPLLTVSMTIGGVAVPPQDMMYVGIPGWSVGTLQINFTVPQNAPVGVQPVVVTVGSAASAAANFTVQ